MVMTILEANVVPEKGALLEAAYGKLLARLPEQMVQTFLVRDAADATLWRAISVWKSAAALDEYKRSVETPGGVLMFRSLGEEPTRSVFDVVAQSGKVR